MVDCLSFRVKVYYEDTDAGGVVYHSNYLNFAERARSEMMSCVGINQSEIVSKYGIFFVVKNLKINFHRPAKLEDSLVIKTEITKLNKASLQIEQEIILESNQEKLVKIENISIVCVKKHNNEFRPTKIPNDILVKLLEITKPAN